MRQNLYLVCVALCLLALPLYCEGIELSVADTLILGDPSFLSCVHIGENRYITSSMYCLYLCDIQDGSLNFLDIAVSPYCFYAQDSLIFSGNRVYVLAEGAYVMVYEVSGSSLSFLARIDAPELSGTRTNAKELHVFGDQLLISYQYLTSSSDGDLRAYYRVYDLSNVYDPQLVADHELPGINKMLTEVLYTGEFYYLVSSDGAVYISQNLTDFNPLDHLPYYPEGESILHGGLVNGRLSLITYSHFGCSLIHCDESPGGILEISLIQPLEFSFPASMRIEGSRALIIGVYFNPFRFVLHAYNITDYEWVEEFQSTCNGYQVYPYGDTYISFSGGGILALDEEFNPGNVIYQGSYSRVDGLILNRYLLVYQGNVAAVKIYDLNTLSWLEGSFNGTVIIPPRKGNRQVAFGINDDYRILTFDDNGSYSLSEISLPSGFYLEDVYDNRLIAKSYFEIKVYEFGASSLTEIANTPNQTGKCSTVFYDADHFADSGYWENFGFQCVFYKIGTGGIITEILRVTGGSVGSYYVADTRLVYVSSGKRVFDLSDPDAPQHIGNLNFDPGTSAIVSHDGVDRIHFASEGKCFITDEDFDLLCSFTSPMLYYYSRNTLLADDGSTLVFLAHPEDISSDDPLAPNVKDHICHIYPNPIKDELRLQIRVKEPGPISVEIFNIRGQKLRSLHQAWVPSKELELVWDAKDASGKAVAAGIYLVKVNCRGAQDVRKAIVLKH